MYEQLSPVLMIKDVIIEDYFNERLNFVNAVRNGTVFNPAGDPPEYLVYEAGDVYWIKQGNEFLSILMARAANVRYTYFVRAYGITGVSRTIIFYAVHSEIIPPTTPVPAGPYRRV